MNPQQTLETIAQEDLLGKVREMRQQGRRLVQICATRLPEELELTYSFDLDSQLASLRMRIPAAHARIPSITPIYGCAVLYENEMHDLFNLQVEGMSLDFHGNFYKTAIKYPFGSFKAPMSKPSPAAEALPTAAAPAK